MVLRADRQQGREKVGGVRRIVEILGVHEPRRSPTPPRAAA